MYADWSVHLLADDTKQSSPNTVTEKDRLRPRIVVKFDVHETCESSSATCRCCVVPS